MKGKQGLKLYLKQRASLHGSLTSECYQLAHSGGLSTQEIRDAIRAGLELYDERMRKYEGRQAA